MQETEEKDEKLLQWHQALYERVSAQLALQA